MTNNINVNYNKKKIPQDFVILFLILVIASFCIYFIIMPLHQEAEIKKLEINIKEQNIKSREFQLKRIQSIEDIESKENYLRNMDKIKNLISDRDNYEDYLAHIEKLAKDRNINIESLSVFDKKNIFKNKEVENNVKSKGISFSASGSFENFIDFLENIERSIPFVQVDSVSMKTAMGISEENESELLPVTILNYNIEISFFYY
ncbi:MAG: GspMb/PilO family protein [Patescibacteria group bacterium]|nr:GspMb/PilO family protein [Patescibacteria group bacterium]